MAQLHRQCLFRVFGRKPGMETDGQLVECKRLMCIPGRLKTVVSFRASTRRLPVSFCSLNQVVERGADYSVLQSTTHVNGTNQVHRYVEVATGLNFKNSYGQWTESREEIDILPRGGAAATQGRHKVYFPADIFNGALEVVTPDGWHLKSRPLGVSYDDATNTVLIATLKHSSGVLTSSNTVTYPDAFTGIQADLVCTYRRGGFECDLVFREQPVAPDASGLNAANSRVQLITEFFNTPDPAQIRAQTNHQFGLRDATLKFGAMTMGRGKAFAVGSQTARKRSQASVYKSWLHLQGRTFLIEEVPLVDMAADLNALPLGASIQKPSGLPKFASQSREFPPAPGFVADTNQILVASTDLNQRPGVVLNYDEIDSDTNDFTFQANTTYFNNGFSVYGTATFEGGAVIKNYDEGSGGVGIGIYSDIVCETEPDHPVVFTSVNDDSVGEIISGSTGEPGQVMNDSLDIINATSVDLHDFRFLNTEDAFVNWTDVSTNTFWNCQFVNCYQCINLQRGRVNLNNVLFDGFYCGVQYNEDDS
jgi:hypothetical protein